MKFKKYEIREDLLYTKEHEWVDISRTLCRVGITDYAAKTLTDIVYVSLPQVGQEVVQFKTIGSVESVKAVSDIYSPITGKVEEINSKLELHPELVNNSPYDEGWLVVIKPYKLDQEKVNLLNAQEYISLISSEEQ